MILLTSAAAAQTNPTTTSSTTTSPACPLPNTANMTMTFDDEFTGPGLDTTKWTATAQGGATATNNEQEAFIPSAVSILPGGGLRLHAQNTSFGNQPYTSGRIVSMGHFAQTYGYFETKANFPDGNGFWSAFWMLPQTASWPPEIDIAEYVYAPWGNTAAGYMNNNIFWPVGATPWTAPYNSSGNSSAEVYLTNFYQLPDPWYPGNTGDWGNAYHTYAVDWRPGMLAFYIDGVQHKCWIENADTKGSVPTQPMAMILSLGMAAPGTWPGTVDPATLPTNLDVAYVHAYQYNDLRPTPSPLSIMNPAVSSSIVHPGDTIGLSANLVIGNATLSGPTSTTITIYNYDATTTINQLNLAGPATYLANTIYPVAIPYTVPANLAPGIYTLTTCSLWNGGEVCLPSTDAPTITVAAASLSCGSTLSGQTVNSLVSTTAGSVAATAAQCPYGGTQAISTTVTQAQLCTNGVLSNQGAPVSTTLANGDPACNAPAACGATPSGDSINNLVSTLTGSMPASAAQCPYGGTQATTTTIMQSQLCTNGTLSNQGTPVSTTVANGNPVCNPAPVEKACGATPSGQTVSTIVETRYGIATPTVAQCPYGGIKVIQTTISRMRLCTNGKFSLQGAPVITTVDVGRPLCMMKRPMFKY